MSQVLEYVQTVRNALMPAVQVPYDQIAWVVGLQVAAVTKAEKFRRGDVYRDMARALSRQYRAVKEEKNLSGLEAYTQWYNMGVMAFKKMKKAAAALATATPGT
ncbi:MAG: hypothetical protein ACPL4I_10825 [Bacteroidota bacterium]